MPPGQWEPRCKACVDAQQSSFRQPRCHDCDPARLRRLTVVSRMRRLLEAVGLPKNAIQKDASLRNIHIRGLVRLGNRAEIIARLRGLVVAADVNLTIEPFADVAEERPLFAPPIVAAPPPGTGSFVRVLEARATAGPPRDLQHEGVLGYVDTGRRLAPSDHFAMHVEGSSMRPLIEPGSLCVFRRDELGDHLLNQVVLADLRSSEDPDDAGRVLVKWLRRRRGGLVLESENRAPEFAPIAVPDPAMLCVRGRFLSVLRAA
jgi:hypothetical protein